MTLRKKISIVIFVLFTMVTMGAISFIAKVTWEQYKDTKEWQNTKLSGDLKDVPPFLARNYVRAEDKEAVAVWKTVADVLEQIETEGKIPEDKFSEYEALLEQSKEKQKSYDLKTGEVVDQSRRLRLYLDIEKVLSGAYETPSTKELKDITDRLYEAHIEESVPLHDRYFKRLRTVAKDYKELSGFLSGELIKLGDIKQKILTVKINVGPETTKSLLNTINGKHLDKFPFVKEIKEQLEDPAWDIILRRNEISRAYETWKQAEQKLSSVEKSQYYAPSEITTYQEALDAGLSVEVTEKEGFTIDPESPVAAVSYQGNPVGTGQYIRYGTPVIVQISEQYIEIPKPEIEEPDVVEEPEPFLEDTEIPDDKPEQNEQSPVKPVKPEEPEPVKPTEPSIDDGWDTEDW